MAYTPSTGIDQNQDGKFIDKYYGRIPIYLHSIPEARIYECNEEYIELVIAFIDGTLELNNIGVELHRQLELTVDALGNYGLIPMPGFDPLFECMGFTPQVPNTSSFISRDDQYNGAVFWTANRQSFGVQPK